MSDQYMTSAPEGETERVGVDLPPMTAEGLSDMRVHSLVQSRFTDIMSEGRLVSTNESAEGKIRSVDLVNDAGSETTRIMANLDGGQVAKCMNKDEALMFVADQAASKGAMVLVAYKCVEAPVAQHYPMRVGGLRAYDAEWDADVARIKKNWVDDVAELKKEHQAVVDKLEEEHKAEVESLKAELAKNVELARRELEREKFKFRQYKRGELNNGRPLADRTTAPAKRPADDEANDMAEVDRRPTKRPRGTRGSGSKKNSKNAESSGVAAGGAEPRADLAYSQHNQFRVARPRGELAFSSHNPNPNARRHASRGRGGFGQGSQGPVGPLPKPFAPIDDEEDLVRGARHRSYSPQDEEANLPGRSDAGSVGSPLDALEQMVVTEDQ
ncbi:hypothetical protein ACHAQA_010037 [Verticillium albo-atrum]